MAGIRAKKKQKTRQKLKEAAIALFLQSPISSVGPPDIARAAGVAQGTFYVHFTDRNELVDHLVEELNTDINTQFLEALMPLMHDPVTDGLRVLARLILRYHREHRELVPLYLDYITRGDREFITGTNTVLLKNVKDMLSRLPNTNISDLQADLTAHSIVALWRQFSMRNVKANEDEQEIAEHLVETTLTIAERIAPDARQLTINAIVSVMMESA